MKVLVIGSGGREHSLVEKIFNSSLVDKVFCAPGNAGTDECGTNVPIPANDIKGLVAFAKKEKIDLTVVGPEDPLVHGIVDEFQKNGLKIFGPNKKAAQLEGSKIFTKRLLEKYGIPTAKYQKSYSLYPATKCIMQHDYPLVIKADGLAAGKGVYICNNFEDAFKALYELMIEKKFGDAGTEIIIEDFLKGEEASCIYFVDYNGNILPLASSQDHKAVGDGDTGPNTGGMGAYSPAPVITKELEKRIMEEIIRPTVKAMATEGCPYTGVLYAGLMIDSAGNPKVLEYNARMGDPETQPLMMRMNSDLVPILLTALDGKLDECKVDWTPYVALCVVMAAKGYPGSYEKGFRIDELFNAGKDAHIHQAGTTLDGHSHTVSSGGRVLNVTALSKTYLGAQQKAYKAIEKINSDGKLFCRNDIGYRAINREAA